MDNRLASANKVISGTWGEVWLGGDYVGECYGMSAKVAYNKEDVALCGRMVTDKKITSIACTGKLSLYKVNSRMANKITKNAMNGIDSRFTIVSKLSDPDAYGSERVVLTDVSFDDLTLAEWEAGQVGKVEAPFTFGDYYFQDTIAAE